MLRLERNSGASSTAEVQATYLCSKVPLCGMLRPNLDLDFLAASGKACQRSAPKTPKHIDFISTAALISINGQALTWTMRYSYSAKRWTAMATMRPPTQDWQMLPPSRDTS